LLVPRTAEIGYRLVAHEGVPSEPMQRVSNVVGRAAHNAAAEHGHGRESIAAG
jgi:hypothetical protein